jgi:hypothetical protein
MDNLIVATHRDLLIVNNGKVLESLSGEGFGHYGVTWNDHCIFALFARSDVLDGSGQFIRVFNEDLEPVRDILHDQIFGVHQIQWYDGLLWVCSTNFDEILGVQANGDIFCRWYPAPDRDPDHPGKDHINSIWFDNGYVYVVAHGMKDGVPAIYRYLYPPRSKPDKAIPSIRGGHCVCKHRGDLLTLGAGMVGWRGQPYWLDTNGTHILKGLAITDRVIYVGASRVIEDRGTRRKDQFGRILALDHTLELWRSWDLDSGPVNEVRVLDEPDYAHHGMPWYGKYGRMT